MNTAIHTSVRKWLTCIAACSVALLSLLFLPSALAKEVTQEDVFKSIQQNVSESDTSGKTLSAVALGGVAVIMLLTLFSSRNKRAATPKALNHPGKLLKELTKSIPLRKAELKQLRLLAEGERQAGIEIDSPVLFLLCPSTFTAAMRSGRVKVDRKVVAGLARKLGLTAVKK
jgi:hypothetical protein